MLVQLMSAEFRLIIDAYTAAWRRGDADAVMALLAPDAVILPHDGVSPRVGQDAIRQFWFGTSRGSSGIDDFRFDIRDISERGDTAVAWGARTLRYWSEVDGKRVTYLFDGTVLIVFGRREGSWRITHFMWDDPPAQVS